MSVSVTGQTGGRRTDFSFGSVLLPVLLSKGVSGRQETERKSQRCGGAAFAALLDSKRDRVSRKDAKTPSKAHSFIDDGHWHLALYAQSPPLQLSGQHHLIHRLEQPGPQLPMHLQSCIHYHLAHLVLSHLGVLASWRESPFIRTRNQNRMILSLPIVLPLRSLPDMSGPHLASCLYTGWVSGVRCLELLYPLWPECSCTPATICRKCVSRFIPTDQPQQQTKQTYDRYA
jgi:hypothetical protein